MLSLNSSTPFVPSQRWITERGAAVEEGTTSHKAKERRNFKTCSRWSQGGYVSRFLFPCIYWWMCITFAHYTVNLLVVDNILYMYLTTTRCFLMVFEKELFHHRALSVRGWSVLHSLLMDAKTGNPLILSISCRRLFFSPLKGLHFCVKAHRKLRGWKLLSGRRSCTSNPLCVC